MRKLGFSEQWVKLLILCVTTVSYSILVNGEPKGMIHPTRGIRQGDPLSPFLFLLCTEGLHGLINQASLSGEIQGYQLCRNSPKLTHLLFADDSLLFCRATVQECQKVLEILEKYGRCSGQQINKNKTTIFFSKLTSEDMRTHIKQALEFLKSSNTRSTWGCPHLWVGGRRLVSTSSRKRCGGSYKDGKRSYFHKQEGRY